MLLKFFISSVWTQAVLRSVLNSQKQLICQVGSSMVLKVEVSWTAELYIHQRPFFSFIFCPIPYRSYKRIKKYSSICKKKREKVLNLLLWFKKRLTRQVGSPAIRNLKDCRPQNWQLKCLIIFHRIIKKFFNIFICFDNCIIYNVTGLYKNVHLTTTFVNNNKESSTSVCL